MTFPVRHISVSVRRPPDDVYAFASDATNLPKWATGLGASVRKDGDAWIAESPMGTVRMRFVPRNTFGVLDHDVTLPSGITQQNPLRVLPNGDGSEVVFTLYHRPEMSDEEFEADAATIEADLQRLKTEVEAH